MLNGPGSTIKNARALRRAMSLPEVLLWRELRLRPDGFKCRRQQATGHYVVDFYCAAVRLAIEVDGEAHSCGDRPTLDQKRDASLKADRVSVLRISAADIWRDVEVVIRMIVAHISRLPLHHPAATAALQPAPYASCPRHDAGVRPPPRSGEDQK